jgi:hypothetical protein
MDTTELQERLRDCYSEARVGTEDLVGLFTATCEYYYAKEKLPAHFDLGRASVQPPRPEELKRSLIPQIDYVAYEVGVDGMWLPQSEAMGRHIGWLDSRDNVSKRGTLRFVRQFNKDFSESDLIDLRTPDGWTLLRSGFEEHGYDVAPTAKSRTALGQLALLGGVENLRVVASSKVHALLKSLSLGRGQDVRVRPEDRASRSPDATHWRYKINELYAHGHDQGTLTPLLTLNAMHAAWGTSSIYGGLAFYPGVENQG